MQKKAFVVLPKLVFAMVFLLLIAACSTPSETETPESPTQEIQATVTAIPPEPTPQPTREPIPEGLIKIPVPASAVQTAADLKAAERPPRDRLRLAKELAGMTNTDLIPQIPDDVNFQVNDRIEFIIKKNPGGTTPTFQSLPARLRHISDNAYWWTSVKATLASDEEIVAAADNFEKEIIPINHLMFGQEWSPGIDRDPRIHILMVQEPNWGNIYGYYSDIHEYPQSIEPKSNEKEMFFLNLGAVAVDSVGFAGELSHELHHLIHWNQDKNEDLWFQEAISELAKFLVGAGQSRVIGSNNAELFAEDPTIQLTSWPERSFQGASRPLYGAVWLFSVYLFEQFGPELIRDIVQNPAPGVVGIQEELAKLPGAPSFDDVYADWLVANLLNFPNMADGQYGYQEISPAEILFKTVQLFNGDPISDQLPPYGAQYHLVSRDQPVQVSFNGSTLARVTPVDAFSGEYVWYSNRGDETEFTLTRTFDLSQLDTATLNFKTWYELDAFFDFAYLEVSTDGGETWEIVETAHGTDEDPYEVSHGIGYTGSSVEWKSESIDLSPYSGQEIQLRFHVITDLTVNRDGFQMDDIAIPELGFFDGAEDDSGEWEARGFVRSSNFVPIEWIVWLITPGSPPQVSRIELDAEQSAEFDIAGLGSEYSRAVVIVSPTARTTTLEQDYELIFQYP